MAYNYGTFAQAKQLLANQLGDAGKIHFVDPELGIAIIEALRTWNSIALYFRSSVNIELVPNQAFYDISNLTDNIGNPGPNNYTVIDREMVNSMQFSLYEPVTTNWTLQTPAMTDMFTVADFQNALQKRRDQFLVDTGCRTDIFSVSNPSFLFDLDPRTIDIRRMSWNTGSTKSVIWPSDEFALNSYASLWRFNVGTHAIPKVYSRAVQNTLQVQLYPNPPFTGTLTYYAVASGLPLNTATGTLIGIPDDLTWAVRWGALHDLLSRDGQAKDPARAQYCLQRYNEGVQITRRVFTTIEQFVYNGISTLNISAMDSLDKYSPAWENGSGNSRHIGILSPNMFALAPVPDSNFDVALWVVANATVPSADGDFIQVGPEIFQTIINYAAHLCLFKEEGAEFFNSMDAYKQLFEMAQIHNARLRAQAEYFDVLNDRGFLDEKYFKRLKEQAA